MTARALAHRFALYRHDGQIKHLAQLVVAGATPLDVRETLLAFYVLRDATVVERAALAAEGAALRDRLAAAGIAQEIEEAIGEAHRRLSQLARVVGKPRVVPGCRGGTPAVDGAWMPRFAPAVGPARVAFRAGDITLNDDPLCCASEVQELPWNIVPSDTHETEGKRSC